MEAASDKRKSQAHAAFHMVPPPSGAMMMPRAGSLKSAALFVLYKARKAATTREVGKRIKTLAWAPVGWSDRRLATVLGEMTEKDGLIESGDPVRRVKGEGGPLHRKTWRWKS